jgi:hypothetical protein
MEARVLPLLTSNPVFDRGSRQMQQGRVLLSRNAPQRIVCLEGQMAPSGLSGGQWGKAGVMACRAVGSEQK